MSFKLLFTYSSQCLPKSQSLSQCNIQNCATICYGTGLVLCGKVGHSFGVLNLSLMNQHSTNLNLNLGFALNFLIKPDS